MPYSSYEQVDFAVPTSPEGDCYARYLVRIAEMREWSRRASMKTFALRY